MCAIGQRSSRKRQVGQSSLKSRSSREVQLKPGYQRPSERPAISLSNVVRKVLIRKRLGSSYQDEEEPECITIYSAFAIVVEFPPVKGSTRRLRELATHSSH